MPIFQNKEVEMVYLIEYIKINCDNLETTVALSMNP